MKRLPAVLAVSTSLFACAANNDGEGGAYLEGLRPAKPSIDDVKEPVAGINPAIRYVLDTGVPIAGQDGIRTPDGGDVSADAVNVPFPIEGLCTVCDVIVLRDARDPGALHVIDDNGKYFCRIWVADDGHLVSTECR